MWEWPMVQLFRWVTRWITPMRLEGALNAGDDIPDGAGDHEPRGRVVQQSSSVAPGREPEIGERDKDRYRHA